MGHPILFLHVVDADNINSQANNTKAILTHWDSGEHPVEVLHFGDPDPAVASNPNVRLIRIPRNRLWKAKALKLAARRYSAVYYPGLEPVFDDSLRRLRRKLGQRDTVVTTLEGLTADRTIQKQTENELSRLAGHRVFCQGIQPASMQALSRIKQSSDLMIAISPFLERVASQIWPGPCITTIPLGVKLDTFNARGRTPHGQNSRPHVISAGACSPHKRPAVLADLARAFPQADFTWFGDGTQRTELQEQVAKEGLRNIAFPGAVRAETLAQKMREADVFILPSVAEGVPKVTQEAAACGLPLVCMHYYEPFSIHHGRNGYLAKDDKGFFGHVAGLIADASLRARMGTVSAELAQGWSWEILARRWQRAICDAAAVRTVGEE